MYLYLSIERVREAYFLKRNIVDNNPWHESVTRIELSRFISICHLKLDSVENMKHYATVVGIKR